jgi:hypothetical protein
MSENKNIEETFDHWLAAGLKNSRPANAGFSLKVMREIERIKAQELLRQAVLQERMAGAALILAAAGGLCLLCYKPLLLVIYSIFESSLTTLIHSFIVPSPSFLGITTLVLIVLALLTKAIWEKIEAEI